MTHEGELIAERYRIVSQIGTGAMGVVWQARDERLQRVVAVKQLLLIAGMSETEAEAANRRAMREGRIAARLHHPHAITVYDVAEHEGKPCLIMEFMHAESLSAVLGRRGALPPEDVARIGSQIASALAAAHRAGIVHRDIKPGNILLADDGTAKITDFGISRAVGDGTVTATGIVAGTPAYLAPEVAQGQKAGFPADVFSLGSTLYTAVEGEPPFGLDDNFLALLYRIATTEITPPRQPGPLTPVLTRILERDISRRPTMQHAQELLAAVADRYTSPAPAWRAAPVPSREAPSRETAAPKAAPTSEPKPSPEPTPTPETAPITQAAPTRQTGPAPETETVRETEPAPKAAIIPKIPETAPASKARFPAAADVAGPGRPIPEPSPAPQRAPTVEPPGTDRRRQRWALVAVSTVAILAITLGVILTAVSDDDGNPTAGPASSLPGTTQEAPTTTQDAAPRDQTPTTPTAVNPPRAAPAQNPPADAPDPRNTGPQNTPEELRAAVSDYYALMPENLDAGWRRLTSDYQTNHAGGFSGYQSFWNAIQRVEASNVSATPPTTATATLKYFFKDGRVVTEQTSFGLVAEDGIWKIGSSSVLSSRTVSG